MDIIIRNVPTSITSAIDKRRGGLSRQQFLLDKLQADFGDYRRLDGGGWFDRGRAVGNVRNSLFDGVCSVKDMTLQPSLASIKYWKTRKGTVIKETSISKSFGGGPAIFTLVTDEEEIESIQWQEPKAESLADFCESEEV